ncbi:MAG: hypothetical protein IJ313_05150 [Clostridia bacterium]|nr:hypothetical protein [Clostridia bacterium]
MDKRQRLERGSILAFPGMECSIEEEIGCGSNAIVYKGWYRDQLQEREKHHVLIKELFPFHKKGGVRRGSDNRICVEEGEPLAFFLMHRESFEAGNRIHLRLLESCPEEMGANLNSFEFNGTLYTILGCSGGRSLDEELALTEGESSLKRYAQLMLHLLNALAAFHDSGYLHLDISPDNALLIGRQRNERIMLIDYNSAKAIGDTDCTYLSYKAGYSAPEVEMGEEESICEASDLYSVAAVFYRMLMGRTLTLEETLAASAPDAAQSSCLQDVPQTVKSLVRSILRRGLCIMPEDRYQTISQMRRDFAELIDRIDCVGVTHWALWESGKRSVDELIRVNPSLSYVKDEGGMYPIRLEQDGRRILLGEYLEEMMAGQGKSRLTVSPGGMGKTTLLLKAALLCGRRYAPGRPAVFYISLAGFSGAEPRYIRSQILASLRFGRENNTFDSALHELEQLLSRTIKSNNTELPMVLLLLDGLNEVRGDAAPLVQEVNLLSRMAGVRIMAASRSEMPALEMETNRILSLTFEDVERAAAARGVLLPQSEQLLQLVRTPLILSIYLTASESSQQLHIRDQDDLMRAYMASLYQKEIRNLPENSPQRWRTDAALTYVLPAIAAQTIRAGSRLTDAQLLGVVEQCYKVLTSRLLQQSFPQWIGRSRDILGEAKSAEAWYGQMVHDLLWQRLGLLIKDERGSYGVFHQVIAEYLSERHKENAAAIRRRRMIRSSIFGMIGLLVFMACFGVYAAYFMITPYEDADVEYVLSEGRSAYDWYMSMYEEMQALIDLGSQEPTIVGKDGAQAEFAAYALFAQHQLLYNRALSAFEVQYGRTSAVIRGYGRTDDGAYIKDGPTLYPNEKESQDTAKRVYAIAGQERKVVSWSDMPLDGEGIMSLYSHLWDRQTYYADVFLPEFKRWYYGSRASDASTSYQLKNSELYLEAAQRMLDYDAQVCQILYNLYLSGHMTTGELSELEAFSDLAHHGEVLARVRSGVAGYGEAVSEMLLNKVKLLAREQKGMWDGLMALFTGSAQTEYERLQELISEEQERISSVISEMETRQLPAELKYKGLK